MVPAGAFPTPQEAAAVLTCRDCPAPVPKMGRKARVALGWRRIGWSKINPDRAAGYIFLCPDCARRLGLSNGPGRMLSDGTRKP